jgi:hypothetical protein
VALQRAIILVLVLRIGAQSSLSLVMIVNSPSCRVVTVRVPSFFDESRRVEAAFAVELRD